MGTSSLSNLKVVVYGAARVGDRDTLSTIMSCAYGKQVYEMYSEEILTPAEVARKSGHDKIAEYILQLERK